MTVPKGSEAELQKSTGSEGQRRWGLVSEVFVTQTQEPGVVAHACNPMAQKTDMDSLGPASQPI